MNLSGTSGMPDIIFDNCVLSNFALSEAYPIIETLYANTAYVTDFVAAENMTGIARGHDKLVVIRQAIMSGRLRELNLENSTEKQLFETLAVSLGLGEASSLAIAKTRNYVFACDDRAARKEAGLLGVKLTGTIGILAKAVHCKISTERKADDILKSMVHNGFYSPVVSIRDMKLR